MFSRNNLKQYQKYANHQQRWALRKYSFGVASVMVGMTLGLLGGTQVAAADQEQPGPVAMLNDSPSTVDKQTVPMGTASNPTNSIPDNVPVTTNDELVTDHPTVKARMMVSLVDDITSQTISTVNLAGQPGSTIDFTIAEDQITKYTQAGYEVVKHDLPTGRTNYDSIDDSKIVSQAYTVHLTHGTVTIDVDNPQLPGTPINPQDPASPIYTEEQANVDADYLLLVKYRGASKNPPTILQNSRWTRSVMIDKVTGKTLSTTPWITPDSYNTVKTPIVPGYYADQAQVVENLIPENQTYTVNYQPVGKMIIQDAAGHRFPNQPDVVYANDPLDATKVLANQPVPVIIGYTPAITVVTPIQPGEDTIVTYTPRLVADEVHTSQTIRYVGAGKVTPQPDVQLFTFVGQRNELTGETTWEVDDHTFGKVTTPVIIGYYADLAVAGGETVTPADSQRDITVTYTPVG
ncbi:mucin-binding protein [Limosilactobacillus equigenerosi]|nr:YSIRK-type signal peptide-containing protein [Limosilactobacillus equigenerosi]